LAGSLPQTPLEELTVLPQTPSWFKEALYLRGGEGKGSKGRGERERRGVEWKGGQGSRKTGINSCVCRCCLFHIFHRYSFRLFQVQVINPPRSTWVD